MDSDSRTSATGSLQSAPHPVSAESVLTELELSRKQVAELKRENESLKEAQAAHHCAATSAHEESEKLLTIERETVHSLREKIVELEEQIDDLRQDVVYLDASSATSEGVAQSVCAKLQRERSHRAAAVNLARVLVNELNDVLACTVEHMAVTEEEHKCRSMLWTQRTESCHTNADSKVPGEQQATDEQSDKHDSFAQDATIAHLRNTVEKLVERSQKDELAWQQAKQRLEAKAEKEREFRAKHVRLAKVQARDLREIMSKLRQHFSNLRQENEDIRHQHKLCQYSVEDLRKKLANSSHGKAADKPTGPRQGSSSALTPLMLPKRTAGPGGKSAPTLSWSLQMSSPGVEENEEVEGDQHVASGGGRLDIEKEDVRNAGMMMEYGRLQERYLQIEKDLSQEARRITLETCQRMTQAEDRSKREASHRAALEKRLAIKEELLGLLKVSNATIKEDIERMDAMLQASAAEVKRYKSHIKKQAKQLDACNQTCAELSRELQSTKNRLTLVPANFSPAPSSTGGDLPPDTSGRSIQTGKLPVPGATRLQLDSADMADHHTSPSAALLDEGRLQSNDGGRNSTKETPRAQQLEENESRGRHKVTTRDDPGGGGLHGPHGAKSVSPDSSHMHAETQFWQRRCEQLEMAAALMRTRIGSLERPDDTKEAAQVPEIGMSVNVTQTWQKMRSGRSYERRQRRVPVGGESSRESESISGHHDEDTTISRAHPSDGFPAGGGNNEDSLEWRAREEVREEAIQRLKDEGLWSNLTSAQVHVQSSSFSTPPVSKPSRLLVPEIDHREALRSSRSFDRSAFGRVQNPHSAGRRNESKKMSATASEVSPSPRPTMSSRSLSPSLFHDKDPSDNQVIYHPSARVLPVVFDQY